MWEVLKTGNLSKITKTDKKRVLSEFILRNPNYKNIKRNIIQPFKNNVSETYVHNINEYDIFIKRDNTFKGIAC